MWLAWLCFTFPFYGTWHVMRLQHAICGHTHIFQNMATVKQANTIQSKPFTRGRERSLSYHIIKHLNLTTMSHTHVVRRLSVREKAGSSLPNVSCLWSNPGLRPRYVEDTHTPAGPSENLHPSSVTFILRHNGRFDVLTFFSFSWPHCIYQWRCFSRISTISAGSGKQEGLPLCSTKLSLMFVCNLPPP